MGTMRREVADIRTRFSVVGLDAVASGFRSVGGALASVTRLISGTGAGAGAAASAAMSASGQIVAATKDQIRAAEELARAQVKAAREGAQAREKAAADALADAQKEAAAAARRARNNNRLSKTMLPSQREDALEARRVAREEAKAAQQVVTLKAAAYKEELTRSRQSVAAAEAEGKAKVAAARSSAREVTGVTRTEGRAQTQAARDASKEQAKAARETAAAIKAQDREKAKSARETAREQAKADREATTAAKKEAGEREKVAKELADKLKTIAKVAVVAGLGYGAYKLPQKGYDLARRATDRAAEYTTGQFNTSLSTGLPVGAFQVLSDAAKSFGIDTNDLRSSLIQLQGQIKAADQGPDSDIGKAFAQLGVQTRDENGQLKTTNELLIPLVRALQGLGETDRVAIGAQLFGEDDVGKLMPLFNQIAAAGNGNADSRGIGNDFLKQRSARLAELGGFISQADLARAQQYRQAVGDMETAWNGLSREIAAAVGPDVSRMLSAAATDLARNRVIVAAAFREAFTTFYSLTRDIGIMIFGGRQYDGQVANRWLLPVRDGLQEVGRLALATGRLMREAYIVIQGGRDAEVREFPWLISLRNGFTKAVVYATTFAKDVRAVVTFQDQDASGQFPWMQTFRDKLVSLVDYAKTAWRELGEVWSGTNSAPDTGPAKLLAGGLGELKAFRDYVGDWATWFQGVGADVATVWQQIGTGNRSFDLNNDGLRKFAEGFLFAADAASKAWGWFKSFYDVVYNAFRDYLGLDFEAILFFVAFAKFTGVLGFATGALKILKSPLTWLVGAMGQISGAGTAAAAVGSVTTAVGGLSGALAGIAAFATNPLVLALLGIGGGVALATSLKGGVVDQTIGKITDMIYGVDESLATSAAKIRDIQANPSPEQARWRRQRAGMATDDDLAFQGGVASRAQAAADAAWQARNAQEMARGDILANLPGYVPKATLYGADSLQPVVFKIEPAQGPPVDVPGYMKKDLVGEAMAAADRTQRLAP